LSATPFAYLKYDLSGSMILDWFDTGELVSAVEEIVSKVAAPGINNSKGDTYIIAATIIQFRLLLNVYQGASSIRKNIHPIWEFTNPSTRKSCAIVQARNELMARLVRSCVTES
jgi:hypothetical protein